MIFNPLEQIRIVFYFINPFLGDEQRLRLYRCFLPKTCLKFCFNTSIPFIVMFIYFHMSILYYRLLYITCVCYNRHVLDMKQPEGIVQKLVTVGLTPQEAGIYLALLKNQKLRVRDVARELGIMVPSVHRSLASLKRKGFVTTFGKRPLKLMAVEPKLALGKLVGDRYQNELAVERQIEEALKRQTSPEAELGVEFLESKQATYEYTLPLINKLQKEMLILSVGEPIPEEIFLALFRAIKRGVVVKMLAETYNETNRELLKNWKKNGWQVRYMPKPTLDFTLTILDGTVAVVQIRREKEKDQRVGIVIHNPAYAAAQREYFTALWQKAKET